MIASMIRLRPTAVIVRNGAILLIECDEPGAGYYFTLPGGGLQPEEALYEGLRREVYEEAGVEVEVGPLLMVWERTGGDDEPYHQIGLAFRCELIDGGEPHKPEPGDEFQIGVRWLPLNELARVRPLPAVMAHKLAEVIDLPAGVDPFAMDSW